MNYLSYKQTRCNLKPLFDKRCTCFVIRRCVFLTYVIHISCASLPLVCSFVLWIGSVLGLPMHLSISRRGSNIYISRVSLPLVFVCIVTRERFGLAHAPHLFTKAFETLFLMCVSTLCFVFVNAHVYIDVFVNVNLYLFICVNVWLRIEIAYFLCKCSWVNVGVCASVYVGRVVVHV